MVQMVIRHYDVTPGQRWRPREDIGRHMTNIITIHRKVKHVYMYVHMYSYKEGEFTCSYHFRYAWNVFKHFPYFFVCDSLFFHLCHGYAEDETDATVLENTQFFFHHVRYYPRFCSPQEDRDDARKIYVYLGVDKWITVNVQQQTTRLDNSDDGISFVSSASFITEIEEILDQPLKQSCVSTDEKHCVHVSQLNNSN